MIKWIKPTRTEWTSFFVMMPFICLLINNLLFGSRAFTDAKVWLFSFPLIYFIGCVSWYLQIALMNRLRDEFPDIRQTPRRLAILGLSHFLIRSVAFIFIFTFFDSIHFLGYVLNLQKLGFAIYCSLGLTLMSTSMWEANYTFSQWKLLVVEKEKLEQLTILQEFETLKSQVNPHFLFNCFNTLSSLISEDKKQAELFLNELSKVYRYLLRNNEDGLSTLQTEIRFIESYYQLLKTRHGDAVQLEIEIDKKYDQYLLPSLSLQLLLENAVKHNVLSKNKPLVIDIFTTTGNKLVVSNTLQTRSIKGPSNKIGLENIRNKYELLSQPGFQVLEDKTSFSVVLPLIWNKITQQKLVSNEFIIKPWK
jgi:two-component system, LytTR family, sensor kinase